ncbi:MAG TPA: hypothetical protein VKA84_28885, partial [Gemmatimonadaceae bacterium]|nr:hypothetical protein [Gemmatimonadaceae bacterium]
MLHVRRPATAAAAAAAAATLAALLAGAAVMPASVAAQDACKIDYNKPSEIKSLYLAIDFKKDRKSIGDAMRALTAKWDKMASLPAAHLLVGRALMWYASQPDAPATMRRGDLGYATNPEQTVDLVAEMERESAEVDRLVPACRSETDAVRRFVLMKSLNQSVEYINFQSSDQALVKGKLDTARALLERAIRVTPELPYGHFYMSFVARRQNDTTAERAALRRVVELATKDAVLKDTSLASTRRDALINLGMSYYSEAQAAPEGQKARPSGEATSYFRTILAEYPNDAEAAKVQNVLNSSLAMSGDTAATQRIYDDMLANPTKYSDDQLVSTGIQLFNGGKGSPERALRFFESALTVNPNQRDALNNSLNLYYRLKQYDKLVASAPRFLTIEPNLITTYQLIGYAYQELSKAEKDAARKKALSDSSKKYVEGGTKLPVSVQI